MIIVKEPYPSSMVQWSRITHPTILVILPITQCLPTTDFLMLARSSTRVDCPILESAEIWALASISGPFTGSPVWF